MSIDAKIRSVEEVSEGLQLHLEPRRTKHGWSVMGQRILLIEQPTWKPEYGLVVWGNDSLVIIGDTCPGQTGVKRHYRREGYTKLKEDFS